MPFDKLKAIWATTWRTSPVIGPVISSTFFLVLACFLIFTFASISRATGDCPGSHRWNPDVSCAVIAERDERKLIEHYDHDTNSTSLSLFEKRKHHWIWIDQALAEVLKARNAQTQVRLISNTSVAFAGTVFQLEEIENEHPIKLHSD